MLGLPRHRFRQPEPIELDPVNIEVPVNPTGADIVDPWEQPAPQSIAKNPEEQQMLDEFNARADAFDSTGHDPDPTAHTMALDSLLGKTQEAPEAGMPAYPVLMPRDPLQIVNQPRWVQTPDTEVLAERDPVAEGNHSAWIQDTIANIGSALTANLEKQYDLGHSGVAESLHKQAEGTRQAALRELADKRYKDQQAQAEAQRTALREYLTRKYGIETPEGLGTSAAGEILTQTELSRRAEAQRALQQATTEATNERARLDRELRASEGNLTRQAAMERALLRKRGGGYGGGGSRITPDEYVAYLRSRNAPGVEEEIGAFLKMSPKKQEGVIAQRMGQGGAAGIAANKDLATRRTEYGQQRMKTAEYESSLVEANRMIQGMSDADVRILLATRGAPSGFTPERTQLARQALAAVLNPKILERSGAAVMQQEFDRFLQEVGDVRTASPAVLKKFLKRMGEVAQEHRRMLAATYGPDAEAAFEDTMRPRQQPAQTADELLQSGEWEEIE